jgi:hypothetical protein
VLRWLEATQLVETVGRCGRGTSETERMQGCKFASATLGFHVDYQVTSLHLPSSLTTHINS